MISAITRMIPKPFAGLYTRGASDPIDRMKQAAEARANRDLARYRKKQNFCNQATVKGQAQWNEYENLIKAERVRNDIIQRLGVHSTREEIAEASRFHSVSLTSKRVEAERVKAALLERHAAQVEARRQRDLFQPAPFQHDPAPVMEPRRGQRMPRLIPNHSSEEWPDAPARR
jgi:hypothetical protein